jgi:phosphoenolpyruvate synthase/pyruvate phosphate dikinase
MAKKIDNSNALIAWFSGLSKSDVGIAGGKGASLGEMTQAGIPVPNGYVISSNSFERFLEETDLNVELDAILDKVNHKEMQSIENASEEIKALIMNAKMPKDIEKEIEKRFKVLNSKFVAVRSSATSEDSSSAAWAGQLDSFLNTTEKTLLENVKRCWASLFTPRAIFYRFEKGLHETKISVAVVVQKMVDSEVSGIAFSVHPVTQDRNQLIIEAGFGLGEAIVSGQITPDSYVVEKSPRRIIDKNVSEQERGLYKISTGGSEWESVKEKGAQQKLSDKQIMELTEIILRIEKHYGFPCDIEWAFEKGKFYIVQSRPITTLIDKENDKEMPSVSGKHDFKDELFKMKWSFFLGRPYDLFGASIYQAWVDNKKMRDLLGATISNNLYLEEHPSVVRRYVIKKELDEFNSVVRNIVLTDKKKAKAILDKGLELNKCALKCLKKPNFKNIKEALDFLVELTLYATVFPYFAYPVAKEINEISILKKAQKLRAESFYPKIIDEIIKPLAKAKVGEKYSVMTISEILCNLGVDVDARWKNKEQGKRFVYAKVNGNETIEYVDDIFDLIKRLENIEIGSEIFGQTAYPGKVIGRARLILGSSVKDFNEGDILVSVTTNPVLLPLMKKSGAIITDEGGITCHAVIVSRELKKPCIVATKFATHLIKDGDFVEVDADKGIVVVLSNEKNKIESTGSSGKDFSWTKDFLKLNSFDIKEARCSLLVSDILFTEFAKQNRLGEGYSPLLVPYSNKILKQVILEEQMNGNERNLWKVFAENQQEFNRALSEANKIQSEIDKISLSQEKLSLLNDKDLSNYFSELDALCRKWWRYGYIGEEKGLVVDEKLVPLLVKNHSISEEEAREYVMVMSMPFEQSIFSKERKSFLELCIVVSKDKDLARLINEGKLLGKKHKSFLKKIKDYSKKYFYARSDFYSAKVLSVENVLQLILEQCKKSNLAKLEEEYSHIFSNLEELHKKKNNYRKKLVLTKEEKGYLDYFSAMQNWLDKRKLSMLKHFYHVFTVVEEISRRKKVPFDTLSLMTVKEILSLFAGGNIDLELVLKRQEASFIVYFEEKEPLFFFGAEAKELFGMVNQKGVLSDIVKGTVASKGKKGNEKIAGKVRLIVNPSKEDFPEGSVLVTSMTRPEFVPIMKRAAAIVTDEGGVACHAAIVSRELGIPCIIGTKNATKILKDGDLVEIDTDKGVVKISGKNSENLPVDLSNFSMYWSAQVSPLMASMLTETYTKQMEKEYHAGFSEVIVFSNGKKSTCYLKNSDRERFARVMINKFGGNKKQVELLCNELKSKADNLLKFCAETMDAPSKENYFKLRDLLSDYNPYHNAPRHIADFSEAEKLQAYLEDLSKVRVYTEKVHYQLDEYLGAILSKLLGVNKEEVLKHTFVEIEDSLNGKSLVKSEISEFIDYCCISKRDSFERVSEEMAKKIYVGLIETKNVSELKGTTAFKGIVSGKVRVVLDPSKSNDFKEGEILVAEMTRPEYVPIMDKALAVITDGGGALCHAAIVARELKKPCIIGTKNATKVLKDGDLVEVNADKGTIKILNSNSENKRFSKDNFFLTGVGETRPAYICLPFLGCHNSAGGELVVMNLDGVIKAFITKDASIALRNKWLKLSSEELLEKFSKWKEKWAKPKEGLYSITREENADPLVQWKMLDELNVSFWEDAYFLDTMDPCADELEAKIVSALERCGVDKSLLSELIAPSEPTMTQYAAIDFMKLKKGKFEKKKYLAEYWYVKGTWAGGEVLTDADLKEDILPKPLDVNYAERKKLHLTIDKKLGKDLSDLLNLLRVFALWREERKVFTQMSIICYDKVLRRIAEKYLVNLGDLYWINRGELSKLKLGNKFALERMKECAYIYANGSTDIEIIVGEGASKIISEFSPKKKVDSIKGTIACKGIVRGRVRVVTKEHQFGKFQKGEILVAPMTRPEFVPIMGIASAIITDEGGLTSHAAVISRELKIPCIIGTKNATEVFEDGDFVEVDADKGIVKIIKSYSVPNIFDESTVSPEIWKESFRWKYEAWPFFTSVYLKSFEKGNSKYHVLWDRFMNKFSAGHLEGYIPKSAILEKGRMEIKELISGNDSYAKEFRQLLIRVHKATDNCEKVRLNGKYSDLDAWWPEVQGVLSDVAEILFGFDFALSDWMKELQEKDPKLFSSLSLSIKENKPSFINEAINKVIYLVKKYPNDFDRVHSEFLKEYSWFQNSYVGEFVITKDWLRNFYEQHKSKHSDNTSNTKQSPPKGYELLSTVASEAISFRDDKKKLLLVAVELMSDWLSCVCEEESWSIDEMKWLTIDEVLAALKGKKEWVLFAKKCAKENKRIGLMVASGYEVVSEEFFEKIQKNFLGEEKITQLRGMSANKGKIMGKARIILDAKKDGGRLQKGDVLVTSMTRPEFLPLMNNAVAFVTDEGGVTCHAAIVAREMNKPCIISTKIATQVIKDGDLIEVDANNGVVKIIGNSNESSSDSEMYIFRARPKNVAAIFPAFYTTEYVASKEMTTLYGARAKQLVFTWVGEDWLMGVDNNKDFNALGEIIVNNYLKNPEELSKLIKWSEKRINSFKDYIEKSFPKEKIQSIPNKEFTKRYQGYVKLYLDYHLQNTPSWWIGAPAVENRLNGFVADKQLSSEELSVLIEPLEYPTEVFEEEMELLKIASKIPKKLRNSNLSFSLLPKKIRKLISEHASVYGSIPFGYISGKVWDEEEFVSRIVKLFSKGVEPKGEIKKRTLNIKGRLIQRQKLIKQRKFSNKILVLSKMMRDFSYLQDLKKTTQTRSHPFLQQVVKAEISRRLDLDLRLVDAMSCEEITSSLYSGLSSSLKEELIKRNDCSVGFISDGKYNWIYGDEAKRFVSQNKLMVGAETLLEIKGQSASRGVIRGAVRICPTSKDIAKVHHGDILVTSMTTPDFVPAMRLAGAIVTDEGGITAHAAIVSRELNKPCIIGTKIATKVLKDGDLVEVDADKGVVRIITKGQENDSGGLEQIKKFIKSHEINHQNANSNVLLPDFVFLSYVDSDTLHGINFSPMFCYTSGGKNFNQLIPEDYLKQINTKLAVQAINEKGYFNSVFKKQVTIQKKIDSLWKKIDLDKSSIEELHKKFKLLVSMGQDWWKYGVLGEDKGEYLGRLIVDKISEKRGISEEEARTLIEKLSHPSELSAFTKQQLLFHDACILALKEKLTQSSALKNKKFNRIYKKYFKNYYYSKCDFYDVTIITPEVFVSDVFEEIKGKSLKEFVLAKEKTILETKKLAIEKKNMLAKVKPSKEEKELFLLMEKTILMIDCRKEAMMKQFYYFILLVKRLAEQKGVSFTVVGNLCLTEFNDFISGKANIDVELIKKRSESVFIIYRKNKPDWFVYGNEARELFKLCTEKHESSALKGFVASKAGKEKVKGIARIISDPANEKFNTGEILVTSMTRIEFVPLMKKAKGIVTNEGGIACHAAIVSRELGVPAIIGTKVATKLIKNGQEIELDLLTGEIRA